MAKTTIAWTDYSWPVIPGCQHVSPGCLNCYAEQLAATRLKNLPAYKDLAVWRDGRAHWTGESRLNVAELAKPLRWRKPRRIFVCQTGDLFYERNSNEDIAAVVGVMAACPQHFFQVLTKRPERALEWFQWVQARIDGAEWECQFQSGGYIFDDDWEQMPFAKSWPLPNVAIGVTAEDQQRADKRLPLLVRIPAVLRFLSVEPMLGPIDLELPSTHCPPLYDLYHQVIIGCESGPKRRTCSLDFVGDLVRQCYDAGIPAFVKQLNLDGTVSHDMTEWPAWARVRQAPPELERILRA